jgi:hypothetical protein
VTVAVAVSSNAADRAGTDSSSAQAGTPEEVQAPAAGARDDSGAAGWWGLGTDKLFDGLGVDPAGGLFRLGQWRAILDLRASGNVQETTMPGYPAERFYSVLTDQGLTVRNDAWYLVDPRLMTGSASVRFGWQQSRQDAGEQASSNGGDISDYYLGVTLLPEKALNGRLQVSQSENVSTQGGGGMTTSRFASRGAALYLRESSILREKEIAPYFSATLQGTQEELDETTRNAGQVFRREERRDWFGFDAHNGFETADLTLGLEQVDLTNEIFPDGSYRSRSADLSYSLDFGEGLARHADLHANYNDRSGDFAVETLDMDANLFFEHSAYLSTRLFFLLQDVDSFSGSSRAQRADAGVRYQPYLNLATNLDAYISRIAYDTGDVDSEGASAGATYSHGIPAGGTLTLTVNGGLQYTDSQLTSGSVPIVDEPYQAPPVLGAGAGFFLNQTDVVTNTIVVFNVRGGGRLPTAVGIDYEVEVEGSRTRIVPLPTSAVIFGGDPLEVSYSHLVDPSLESRSINQSYSMTMDWTWIAVSLNHDVTRQDPLDGATPVLLSDQNRTTLRVDVRHDWNDWLGRANARAARYRDDRLNYDEFRLNESLTWRPGYAWQLAIDASQAESRFLDTGRVSRIFDARLGGTWSGRRGWWTDGYLTWRTQRDSSVPNETVTEGFVRVRRNWPQLTLSCAVGLGLRERGAVQTTYENLQVNITRTFF